MRSGKRGFTFVELLVVIAVIVTIAGILFPVFAQARESARQTACISNMRQIGLAMHLYLQDHDEVLLPVWTAGAQPLPLTTARSHSAVTVRVPGGVAVRKDDGGQVDDVTTPAAVPWTELIQPYLKNRAVLHCPSFDERVLEENAALDTCDGSVIRAAFPAQYYYAHYGMAWGYTGGSCTAAKPRSRDAGNLSPGSPWRTWAEVVRPAETAVIQDNFTALTAEGQLGTGFGCEGGFRGAGRSRHRMGSNYLFLDGRAKLLTLDPRHEPTISCPGAAIPSTGEVVSDCVCTRYTTFDY